MLKVAKDATNINRKCCAGSQNFSFFLISIRYKRLWILEQKRRRGMERDWRKAALRKGSEDEKKRVGVNDFWKITKK